MKKSLVKNLDNYLKIIKKIINQKKLLINIFKLKLSINKL